MSRACHVSSLLCILEGLLHSVCLRISHTHVSRTCFGNPRNAEVAFPSSIFDPVEGGALMLFAKFSSTPLHVEPPVMKFVCLATPCRSSPALNCMQATGPWRTFWSGVVKLRIHSTLGLASRTAGWIRSGAAIISSLGSHESTPMSLVTS